MSRYVLTQNGRERVNLDRFGEIKIERIGGEESDSPDSRIFGRPPSGPSGDVELVRGTTAAVEALWAKWTHLGRDGVDLGRAIELEEAALVGITPGELRSGARP